MCDHGSSTPHPRLTVRRTGVNHHNTQSSSSTPTKWTSKANGNIFFDLTNSAYLATNVPLQNGPRASPINQGGPPIPNGKPTSPYTERTNPISPSAQIAAQTVSSKDPKAAAQAASDMRNVVRRKLTGYVGFANLPNQWHRKSVRKGFNFNVMVVGKTEATPILLNEMSHRLKVNLVLENPLWSILCSILLSTHRENEKDPVSTSFPRLFQFSPSALISRKTVSVYV